ncbi:MAG: histidinol dehydrogenase [Kiritimatiellia bacterium]
MAKNEKLNVKSVRWTAAEPPAAVEEFLKRPAIDPAAEKIAAKALAAIKARGDEAVLEYIEKFDGAKLTTDNLRVTPEERQKARAAVDDDFKRAAREAQRRITRFAEAGIRKDWNITSPKGGMIGERFVPLDRVGVYIPGGAAPLASTAMMTIVLARAAGVPEVVACTPADKDGNINPALLYAIDFAGATEIFKIGGIQAIGAMAYGTATVGKVQKIVGPGGPFVTAAKRLVYGEVSLDMVAGPSEIAVLADDSISAAFVAADLLSQAEHGSGAEKVLLVTPSERLAEGVARELLKQSDTLPRRDFVRKVLQQGMLIVVTDNLDIGMDICNRFAPEHFEIMVQEPRRWIQKVRAAGAVFAGPWTPESAGDFAIGPSHVLPTGGTAAFFSGLTVDDFQRRMSVMSLTRADLVELLPVIEAFGRVEGLEAHARSARIRFEV